MLSRPNSDYHNSLFKLAPVFHTFGILSADEVFWIVGLSHDAAFCHSHISFVGTDGRRSGKETSKVIFLPPKTTVHSGSLKNYRAGVRATFHQKHPTISEQLRVCSNSLILFSSNLKLIYLWR